MIGSCRSLLIFITTVTGWEVTLCNRLGIRAVNDIFVLCCAFIEGLNLWMIGSLKAKFCLILGNRRKELSF